MSTLPSSTGGPSAAPGEARGWPARLRRRNWYLPALGALCVGLGWLGAQSKEAGLFIGGLSVAWFGFWFALLALLRNAFPLSRPVEVEVEPEALRISGREPIARASLDEARLVPLSAGEALVVLKQRWRTLSLAMAPPDAASLLRRLGLDAGSRRTTFALESRFRTRSGIVFAAINAYLLVVALLSRGPSGSAINQVASVQFPVVFYSLLLAWLLGLLKGRLTIGADGVTIRWFLRERFIPFHSIAEITAEKALKNRFSDDTVLRLTSGERVRLRAPDAPVTDDDRGVESRALHQHLVAAFRLARLRGGDGTELVPLVRRGQQPPRAWLSMLDAIAGDGQSGYRSAAVSHDSLVGLMHDASLAPDARVGAAAALLRSKDPDARAAVRVAAGACAEPRLRVALVALDEADSEEAFVEALERAPGPIDPPRRPLA